MKSDEAEYEESPSNSPVKGNQESNQEDFNDTAI